MKCIQVGPAIGTQGGIASVIEEYLTFEGGDVAFRAYPSWWPHRPLRSAFSALLAPFHLLRNNPDVVNVHLSEFGSFLREGYIVHAAKFLRAKTAVTLHGANFDRFVERRPALAKRILQQADTVICLSDSHERIVRELVPNARIRRVLNPAGVAHSRPRTETEILTKFNSSTVVFAGEIGTRKGFDLLEAAWIMVSERLPSAKLVVCGPVAQGFKPRSFPNVRFLGVVDRASVATEISAATLVCLPSRKEVLPMLVLESLALGTPVVISAAGAPELFRDLVSANVLELDVPDFAAELADQLIRVLSDRSGYASAASEAVRWTNEVSSNGVVRHSIEAVYRELLDGRPDHGRVTSIALRRHQ